MICNIPLEYIYDKMSFAEVEVFMKYAYLAHKDLWESARLVAWSQARTQSSKVGELEDFIKFPWQNIHSNETTITKEDIRRLQGLRDMITK